MSTTSLPAVTVIGAGNIGAAVAQIAVAAGSAVQVLARDAARAAAVPGATAGTIGEAITGDLVVLALPYPAIAEVLAAYPDGLAGKVLVDPSNPIDFGTGDIVIDPVGSSAAAEIAAQVPGATVLKAFNTNFAAALASGTTGTATTAVLIAGDDTDAKTALSAVVTGGGLRAVDAGPLKRAHELEAIGAVQIGLAVTEQTPWTGGFSIVA
ncbi:NADPH-dependent F420 reductase [Brachybacterium sp. DNPG3]